MKNSSQQIGWLLPVVMLLVLLGTAGLSWGAAPKVAAGENHTLFLHADGTLWGSGLNLSGQLGDGTQTKRSQAVRIGSDNHWQSVAAGGEHTLALKSDGTLWAWGSNASGQLGALLPDSSPVPDQSAPLKVGTGRDWVAVAAGTASSYALKADGTLWAWGAGNLGQLGNGQSARQNQPVQVANPGAGRYVALAGGNDHALALQADGSLWSFGGNASGQLGQGATPADPSTPAQVLVPGALSDNDWTAIAAGGAHSLALKADGTLWAWGDNAAGQLGIGPSPAQNTPVRVGTAQDWGTLSAGALHSLALKRNGTLWAWGDNSSGQLGNGLLAQLDAPQQIAGADNLVALGGGAFHSVALKANGGIYSWGGNLDGQLADGSGTGSLLTPTPVGSAGPGWVAGEPGTQFTVARRSNGTLWGWGDNSGGQLANGTAGTDPVTAPGRIGIQDNWASHSAGSSHVVALRADGTLWTWGDNSFGQLGDNTVDPSLFPLQIVNTKPGTAASDDWKAVSAGDFHTLALKGDGTLWAWGDNEFGQLGDGTNTPAGKQPNQVVLGPGGSDNSWTAVAAGGTHSLALQADGTLWAWGDNSSGQLGDDPALIGASLDLPRQVFLDATPAGNPGFNSGWKGIAAGFGYSIGLQADGTLWAWGGNFDGQLGNGDGTLPNPPGRLTPVPVSSAGAAPYVWVAAGDAHVLARQADGTLWSWGNNQAGQLAIGTSDADQAPHATPQREAGNASDWSAAAVGGSHSMALKSDGTLWVWGNNVSGQLADGTLVNRTLPTALTEGYLEAAAAFDLGTGSIGGSTAQNLSIRNAGNGDLFVAGLTVSGANAAQFGVTPGSCGSLAFVLPAGGSCQIRISFQAALPLGAKSATLAISSSDPVQPQHLVALTAQAALHTITLNAGANGSIFGPTSANENATPSYLIVPATGFHVADVTVNGVSRGAITTLTLAPVTADVTIQASFAVDTFAVSFLSGANGTLSGAASQTVNFGASAATVTALPALGYHFVNWTEGAAVVSSSAALTLANVTAARTLTANFAIDTFAVNFLSAGNGTLSGAASQTVDFAAGASPVTALPDPGYHFVNWTEGGNEISTSAALSVSNVTAARTLTANFAINSYPVSFASGGNGTLTGSVSQTVEHGSAASAVSAVAAAGFHFVNWTEGAQVVGSSATLTVANVTAPHSFTANFAIDTFAVNFFSAGNGTLSGAASQTVALGSNASTVTAVPGTGFHFVNWTEGANVLGTSPALTLANIGAARSVTANFAIDTFTVVASSDARGSVSQPGNSLVPYGSSITYQFTPSAGYQVVDVVVDGVSQGAPTSYTFSNVTANGHSIKVVFVPDGDLNGDGQVGIADALQALQIAVGLTQASPAQLRHGDLAPLDAGGIPAPDAQIQVADALMILRKAVGLTSGF